MYFGVAGPGVFFAGPGERTASRPQAALSSAPEDFFWASLTTRASAAQTSAPRPTAAPDSTQQQLRRNLSVSQPAVERNAAVLTLLPCSPSLPFASCVGTWARSGAWPLPWAPAPWALVKLLGIIGCLSTTPLLHLCISTACSCRCAAAGARARRRSPAR